MSRASHSSSIQSWRFTGQISRIAGRVFKSVRRAVRSVASVAESRDVGPGVDVVGLAARGRAPRRSGRGPSAGASAGRAAPQPGRGTSARDATTPASWRRPSPSTSQAPSSSPTARHAAARTVAAVTWGMSTASTTTRVGGPRRAATPASRPASGPPPARRLAGERHRPGASAPVRPTTTDLRGVGHGVERMLEQGPAVVARARPCRRRRAVPPRHPPGPPPPTLTRVSLAVPRGARRRPGGRLGACRWCSCRRRRPRPGRQPRAAGRPRARPAPTSSCCPEAFARDFGEAGLRPQRRRRAARRAFVDRGRAGRRRARHDRGRRAVRAERRQRPFNTVVVRGGAPRRLPQDPSLRLVRLPRVRRRSRAGPLDAGRRSSSAGFTVGADDLLRPAVPRARARRWSTAGAEVLLVPAAWVAGPRKVDHWTHAAAGARDREHRLRRRRRASPARATPATRWSSDPWVTCWSRAVDGRRDPARRPRPRRGGGGPPYQPVAGQPAPVASRSRVQGCPASTCRPPRRQAPAARSEPADAAPTAPRRLPPAARRRSAGSRPTVRRRRGRAPTGSASRLWLRRAPVALSPRRSARRRSRGRHLARRRGRGRRRHGVHLGARGPHRWPTRRLLAPGPRARRSGGRRRQRLAAQRRRGGHRGAHGGPRGDG